MPDDNVQFVNQAQQASRSVYAALCSVAQTQFIIAQRLGGIQQSLFNQTIEAANDQLQLIGCVKEPRGYASAQAELVKSHGQRYVDTAKQAIDVVADVWQDYGDRLNRELRMVADRTQRVSSSRKAA